MNQETLMNFECFASYQTVFYFYLVRYLTVMEDLSFPFHIISPHELVYLIYWGMFSSAYKWSAAQQLLTHWGQDKMDAISQMTFSSAFS